MVYFTCNLCGESLKKPAVEKHYLTKCRGQMKALTCMDCLKDFNGEAFVAHTKCITEVERYSGKDYVHQESKNSGAKKQETWMDIVHSILESSEYKLSSMARNIFKRLQGYENVPQKKAKFQNFVSNCMRLQEAEAEEVWSVLERELEKMKQARQQETKAAKEAKEAAKKAALASKTQNGNAEPPAKKSKVVEAEAVTDEVAKKAKKKNKKDKKLKDANDEAAAVNSVVEKEEESVTDDGPQKAKNKKHKKPKDSDEAAATNGVVDEVPKKAKDKKNKKSKDSDEAAVTNGVAEQKKETLTNGTNKEENGLEKGQQNDGAEGDEQTFTWQPILEKVAQKKGDEAAVEKIKRKTIKKYAKHLGVAKMSQAQMEKFEKKFAKKCKKVF